jgi:hypothetical protein
MVLWQGGKEKGQKISNGLPDIQFYWPICKDREASPTVFVVKFLQTEVCVDT